MKESKFWLSGFLIALLLATGLRFTGLSFGAPSAAARPDEEYVIPEALFLNANDRIRFHRYPPALIYSQAALFRLGTKVGSLPENGIGAYLFEPIRFHIWARTLSAIFGVLTVLVVGITAGRLLGWPAAAVSALALATFPLHNLHSHFATVDIPATFFLSLCLSFSLLHDREKIWHLGLAALFAGIAAGFKYPVGMVALVPLFLALRNLRRKLSVGVVCSATILGLLCAAPTLIFDASDVWAGIQAESASQSGRRALLGIREVLEQHVRVTFKDGFGLALMGLSLTGLVMGMLQDKRLVALLPFSILLVVFNFIFPMPFARYFLPLAPILALGLGALFASWTKNTSKVLCAIALVLMILNAVNATTMSHQLTKQSTGAELIEAFSDGRLPQDLPVVKPEWPFIVFPYGVELLSQHEGKKPASQASFREKRLWEEAQAHKEDFSKLRTITLSEANQSAVNFEELLSASDLLYIVPQTPSFTSDWLNFRFHNETVLPRMQKLAQEGALMLEELIDLDPRIAGGFPEASRYEGTDYWFLPLGAPDSVERMGPRLRVFRISAPR